MSMCTKTRWLLGGTPSRRTSAKLSTYVKREEKRGRIKEREKNRGFGTRLRMESGENDD